MNDMVIVTKEEFFAALYADKRDIMPNHDNPEFGKIQRGKLISQTTLV